MRLIAIVMLSSYLFGCATPKFNYIPHAKNISEPEIGVVTTKSIGEPLLRQGVFTKSEAIQIEEMQKSALFNITKGYFIKQGEDKSYEYFRGTGDYSSANITKALLADTPSGVVAIHAKTKRLCIVTIYNQTSCGDYSYKRTEYQSAKDKSFQQALLYNGINGNKINIGYRESSNDYARPAYNNDVEYDLSKSMQIAYKGARIEIISADNLSITYKVLKNFDPVY